MKLILPERQGIRKKIPASHAYAKSSERLRRETRSLPPAVCSLLRALPLAPLPLLKLLLSRRWPTVEALADRFSCAKAGAAAGVTDGAAAERSHPLRRCPAGPPPPLPQLALPFFLPRGRFTAAAVSWAGLPGDRGLAD